MPSSQFLHHPPLPNPSTTVHPIPSTRTWLHCFTLPGHHSAHIPAPPHPPHPPTHRHRHQHTHLTSCSALAPCAAAPWAASARNLSSSRRSREHSDLASCSSPSRSADSGSVAAASAAACAASSCVWREETCARGVLGVGQGQVGCGPRDQGRTEPLPRRRYAHLPAPRSGSPGAALPTQAGEWVCASPQHGLLTHCPARARPPAPAPTPCPCPPSPPAAPPPAAMLSWSALQ